MPRIQEMAESIVGILIRCDNTVPTLDDFLVHAEQMYRESEDIGINNEEPNPDRETLCQLHQTLVELSDKFGGMKIAEAEEALRGKNQTEPDDLWHQMELANSALSIFT